MNKTQRAHFIIKLNWLLLILAIMVHVFISGPSIEASESLLIWLVSGTFLWFIFSSLLLMFVIPVFKGGVRGLSLMCFMLLLYLCVFVYFGATPNDLSNIVMAGLESLLSATLFTISMYYIRWKKSDLRAELNQQGK